MSNFVEKLLGTEQNTSTKLPKSARTLVKIGSFAPAALELTYWSGQTLSHSTDKVPSLSSLFEGLVHSSSIDGTLRILPTIFTTLAQNWVSFVNSEVFNLGLIKGTDYANKLLDNFVNFASNDATAGVAALSLVVLIGLNLYRQWNNQRTRKQKLS